MIKFSRRSILKAGAAGVVSTALPMPFIRRAYAQGRNTVVYGSAQALTGNWDPTSHTQLAQINLENFVFSYLFRTPMRPENPAEPEWELATGQKLIDEYTMEYTLREGVKFHNGAPFTAADVKATFEYTTDPARPASALYPGQVTAEVVDDLTVRVSTKDFGYPASALQFTGALMPILSKDDVTDPSGLSAHPNGTGPFKFIKQEGDTTHLEANDEYLRGRPKIDGVQFTYVADATARVLGLMSGDIDILQRLEPEQYATVKESADVVAWEALSTENKYLHFRTNKAPFDNPLIRQAACHAIDRQQILAVLGAAGADSSAYVSPLKFGYAAVPGYPEYDPEKCQALLAEAGFPGGQGLPQIDYLTSTGFYPKTKEYGEVITAMMQEQGFNVSLNVMDPAAWEARLYQSADKVADGHMIDCGWMSGSPEPDIVLRAMFYSKAGPGGGLINGVKDADIDAALDKERATGDAAERALAIAAANELIASKAPSLSLFTSVNLNACRAGLKDVYIYPNGPMDLTLASFDA